MKLAAIVCQEPVPWQVINQLHQGSHQGSHQAS